MRPPHHLQGTCLFSLERGEAGAPATQLSFINHAAQAAYTGHRCVRGRRATVTGVALSLLLSLFLSCARVEACLAAVASPTLWRVPHCARGAGPRINESAPINGCVRDHGFDHFLLASLLGGRLYMESPRAMAVEAPISA